MRAILMPVGSHGDVLPMVGLARALAARGVDVCLLANPVFAEAAQTAGVRLCPLGSPEDYHRVQNDPDIHHATRGLQAVSRVLAQHMESSYEAMVSLLDRQPTILIGSTLAFPMRCIREKFGLPMVTIHLQPSVIRSSIDPPALGSPRPLPAWLPRFMVRGFWWLIDSLMVDPLLARPLNQFRQKLGLPPVRRILGDWLHESDLTLGLFPEWFAARPTDWPADLKLTNFPLWDQESAEHFPPGLEEFLANGEPPVVFTGGTGFATRLPFYQECLQACQANGFRGLLLTRHPANVPQGLSNRVRHFPYAPFSQLLPRAAAIVHHGGIGTLAQALAAGIPQVILPQAHDQFDNAWRARRLGVSCGGPLAKGLARALHDPSLRQRAIHLSARVSSGLYEAVSAIEGLPPGIASL